MAAQNPSPKRPSMRGIIAVIVSVALIVVCSILGIIWSIWWFVGAFLAFSVLIFLAYAASWGWTGLPEQSGPPGSKDIFYQGPKTAWDWAQMVIIPLVLLYIGSSFALTQQKISDDAFNMQHTADVQMAQDQLNESEVSTYLTNMAGLLQQQNVRTDNQAGADIRSVARAQTLTLLHELATDPKLDMDPKMATKQPNSERKARVLKFLYESGLISRNPNSNPFPIVSLADADLSYADLRNARLGGADLARADFSGADLSGADLIAADLSQAKLDHVHLNNAHLEYAQITGTSTLKADLSSADLTGADLRGADLVGADLSNAILTTTTDITGTALSDVQKKVTKQSMPWELIQTTDTTVVIAYNKGTTLPAYGTLDLSTSELQLIYGPLSNKSTAIVLLPAFYSQKECLTNYCQTAPVAITNTQIVADASGQGSDMIIDLSGTIAGLPVDVTLQFLPPPTGQDTITVTVTVNAPNAKSIPLDPGHPMDAFKPVVLSSTFFSAIQFGAQQAYIVGQQPASFVLPTAFNRFLGNDAQTFGLRIDRTLDDKNFLVINDPTIEVKMTAPTSLQVTAEEQQSSDPNSTNISLWGVFKMAQKMWPDSWSYTVTASNPYNTTP